MPPQHNTTLVERLLHSNLLQAEWVLYFLLGVLALSVAVMIWKAVYFAINRLRSRRLRTLISQLVAGSTELDDFTGQLDGVKGVEASILRHALRYVANGADVVEQQLDVVMVMRKQRMELGLTFLGTVGANAPFVGLFGTVLGVIKAFADLSLESSAGAAAVMSGISEALVATAVGLVVAIPAVIAFNYLSKEVKKTLTNSNSLNQQVLFRLRAEG